MVTGEEWKEMSKHFEVDHEILVKRNIEESSHSVCQPCMTKRMDKEKKVRRSSFAGRKKRFLAILFHLFSVGKWLSLIHI